MLIKVNAGNDRNGNPRRGWWHLNGNGQTVAFYDEGYEGCAAIPALFRGVESVGHRVIDVTPAEYRALKMRPSAVTDKQKHEIALLAMVNAIELYCGIHAADSDQLMAEQMEQVALAFSPLLSYERGSLDGGKLSARITDALAKLGVGL